MGKGFSLTIDTAAANALAATVALREVTDTTRQVLNRATVLTPVKNGRLRLGNQARVYQRGPIVVGEVYNQTRYAAAVHDGSPAYTVRPRRKKVLRFTVGGKVVFAQAVTIPARKGRPWLYRAMVEVAAPRGYTVTKL
jgi:hypothetical protein